MSLITTFTMTIASQPKAREVLVGGETKQVLDIFGLVITGRRKAADGNGYEDVLMPCELSIWNGVGQALLRDGLSTGDRIAITCKIKGHRAYISKEGEAKSILSLEYSEGASFPLVQKARRADSDAVAF